MNNSAIIRPKVQHHCRFCNASEFFADGRLNVVMTNEHIVPDGLGADGTIENVCKTCNGGRLSKLDRELISRSPLSIIASRELNKPLHELWDFNQTFGNILLESHYDPALDGPRLYPQIVFDQGRRYIWADDKQMRAVTPTRLQILLRRSMSEALKRWEKKRKGIFFEKIPKALLTARFPPRVFWRVPVEEIDDRSTLIIRYINDGEQFEVLNEIDHWPLRRRFRNYEGVLSRRAPNVRIGFVNSTVACALLKIGFNLLARICTATDINCTTFPSIAATILGRHPVKVAMMHSTGFVRPSDFSYLETPTKSHTFCIWRDNGAWEILMSWFGGQVCAAAKVHGWSHDRWRFARLEVPIGRPHDEWKITTSEKVIPQKPPYQVEWEDLAAVVPTAKIHNLQFFSQPLAV